MTDIKNNIQILRNNLKIRTANGNIIHISGITKPLEVNISGTFSHMEFLVFDHDNQDILLGLDWFYKTGSGIYPSDGILDFKNSTLIQNESIIENPEQNIIIGIFHSDVELNKDFYWDMSFN
ncbi:unnamed protein product [Brachionus calyciflorus]|uniref:Uncharacterized protein n=1 Tax=Brachionus calyciflorus TaxID=104777 RepID=A0A814AL63_9BILA|nr:unnamed protein product [Brachionus calyciflorus]